MFGHDMSYDINIPLDPLKFTREEVLTDITNITNKWKYNPRPRGLIISYLHFDTYQNLVRQESYDAVELSNKIKIVEEIYKKNQIDKTELPHLFLILIHLYQD